MTRDDLIYFHRSETDRCLKILEAKNADYASDESPFTNLDACEHRGLSTTEKGILMRVMDKEARIINLLDRPPAVGDESLEDSCRDIINYMILLMAKRKSRNEPRT